MRDEIALGDLGQLRRLGAELVGREQLLGPPLGDPGGPERSGTAPRHGEIKDRRFLVVAEQRC